jgi:hypothetical protein
MSFLNASLLAGLGLVSIPLILHFLLRQKPKRLLFPALRLIEERRKQSVRKLRLRHFWLMVLRMLAIALLVFALARPSLPPANYSLTRMELVVLLAVAAAGISVYMALATRKLPGMAQYQHQERRSRLRNRFTVGTLLAVLLFVGWPYQRRIAGEITDPRPTTNIDLPVSGVMLFDTSLSMSYLQEGKTSLDQARDVAKFHLQSLPSGSRMAISETANDHPILFQSTLLSARNRLETLEPMPVSLPLDVRLRDALRTHEEDRRRTLDDQGDLDEQLRKDRYIRRVYVFTDLSRTAWRAGGSSLLKSELEQFKNVNLYLVDVGRDEFENVALTGVTLSRERIPAGGDLIVAPTLASYGGDNSEETVELLFSNQQGEESKQGQITVPLDAEIAVRSEFPVVSGLNGPLVQGQVRLASSDPLSFDNVRYFSAEVSPPPKVLVLAPREEIATEWMTALAPHDERDASRNRFEPVFEPVSRLPELTLEDYSAVTLINVPRLTDDGWFQLGKYVENGGGLIVVLGSADISAPAYERAQAQAFLPGRLLAWRPEHDWTLRIDRRNHPMFWKFRQYENYGSFAIAENDVWIRRFWNVEPSEQSQVLASYSDRDQSPAILERSHGKGRTVMLTTAVDLPVNHRQRWNNLPSPLLSPWWFIAFAEQTTEYVSRFTDQQRNFQCGETPVIRLEPKPVPRTFLLREPKLKQSRHQLPAGEAELALEGIVQPGTYSLVDAESREPVAGFSINPRPEESDLTRLTEQDLGDLLGENRFKTARNLEELEDEIDAADLGQEVFPVVLMLLIIVFCGEHLVANRFYEEPRESS